MRRLLQAAMLIGFGGLTACGDGAVSMLPGSSGRPYEVLIVADDSTAGGIIDSVLSCDAACLPQPEPEFDVSKTDNGHHNSMTRLARSIVNITVNPAIFTKTRIRYDKNVWAKPQMVVYINTPSTEALRHDMLTLGRKLTSLLIRSEMNAAISRMSKSRNKRADSMVMKQAGIRMCIPTTMKSSKKGHDFVWLSDNAAQGMTSICVYTYPGIDISRERFETMRDSIMHVNIPGETDAMYMKTTGGSLVGRTERIRNHTTAIISGLWEMHNDAMGGPFVAHVMADTARNRVVAAEAFVYAPSMKKRNLIRQAEAALFTAELKGND